MVTPGSTETAVKNASIFHLVYLAFGSSLSCLMWHTLATPIMCIEPCIFWYSLIRTMLPSLVSPLRIPPLLQNQPGEEIKSEIMVGAKVACREYIYFPTRALSLDLPPPPLNHIRAIRSGRYSRSILYFDVFRWKALFENCALFHAAPPITYKPCYQNTPPVAQ